MTVYSKNFLAERRQQLSALNQLQNAYLAIAVAERAVREAETLTGTDRKQMAPVGPAIDAYWDLISSGSTAITADMKKLHKKLANLLPKDEEDEAEAPAWDSAISTLALAFMVLEAAKEPHKYAGSACGEGSHLVTMYYVDADAAQQGEVDWQDKAIALIQSKLPRRDEFEALPDYPRGAWEEPD